MGTIRSSDAGLVHLEGLTNLTILDLRDTQVTDPGLVHLKGLTKLSKLDLNCHEGHVRRAGASEGADQSRTSTSAALRSPTPELKS